MAEQKQTSALDELHAALADVPEEFHAPIAKMLTHDIGVIARTISIIVKQPVA